MAETQTVPVSSKVAIIAITAVLYAIAKGATAFVPTPWGVGELLIGIFVPAFFAVVCDTWSVAIGAGLGTFIGDSLFLTASGGTNPALSLIAGVPANFLAFLLFGWFVKKYKTWGAFVAATISFVTLGNLIAGASIVLFGAEVFTPVKGLVATHYAVGLIFGFTAFWSLTMVPVIIVVVPILVRAVKPLKGRTSVLSFFPDWTQSGLRTPILASALFALVLLAVALLFLPSDIGLSVYAQVLEDLALVIVALVIIVPVVVAAPLAGRKS